MTETLTGDALRAARIADGRLMSRYQSARDADGRRVRIGDDVEVRVPVRDVPYTLVRRGYVVGIERSDKVYKFKVETGSDTRLPIVARPEHVRKVSS